MLDGLIDRTVLDREYAVCVEALKKYEALRAENKDNPVYPNGSTAGLMLTELELASCHIENMKTYIRFRGIKMYSKIRPRCTQRSRTPTRVVGRPVPFQPCLVFDSWGRSWRSGESDQ